MQFRGWPTNNTYLALLYFVASVWSAWYYQQSFIEPTIAISHTTIELYFVLIFFVLCAVLAIGFAYRDHKNLIRYLSHGK